MIHLEDEIHSEQAGVFETFEEAIAELRRRTSIPLGRTPNRAPCTASRTCGRKYHVLLYDTRSEPWKLLRDVHVLDISSSGAVWIDGFADAWITGAA